MSATNGDWALKSIKACNVVERTVIKDVAVVARVCGLCSFAVGCICISDFGALSLMVSSTLDNRS